RTAHQSAVKQPGQYEITCIAHRTGKTFGRIGAAHSLADEAKRGLLFGNNHDPGIVGQGYTQYVAKQMPDEYDLLIVGGGLAGLTAAMYGGRNGLRTAVVE